MTSVSMPTLQEGVARGCGFWLDCSICGRIRRLRPRERQDLCENCCVAKESSLPISSSVKDWSNKLEDWSSAATISDIPTDALLPYLIKCFGYFDEGKEEFGSRYWGIEKGYLVYLSRCVRVSKEWRDYFNDPTFWKHAFVAAAVNRFHANKLNSLMSEKKKNIKTSGWPVKEVIANRCRMVVINETKDIPFDIYWISKRRTKMVDGNQDYKDTLPGSSHYHCAITYPNNRWMCVPTKKWLRDNPYSTLGFTWTIDVFNLEEFVMPDGKEILAYVVRIYEPNYKKMNPIKDTNKDFTNYRKKIIPLVFNQKEEERKWKNERDTRNADIAVLTEVRKKARRINRDILISEKKSKDQMYILNMFD